MTDEQDSRLRRLGLFTLAEAETIGVSQQWVSVFLKRKYFKRIARGIYFHHDAELGPHLGFQIARKKFGPDSVIGGLSALEAYHLLDHVPGQMWVLVPPQIRTREPGYRLLRTLTHPLIEVEGSRQFKIVTLERALLEGLKYMNKMGTRNILNALHRALKTKQTTAQDLKKAAKKLDLENLLDRHLENVIFS